MALYIEDFPATIRTPYNPDDTDFTKGVIEEMSFANHFQNGNFDILSKAQYYAFTDALDAKCKEVDGKVVLSESEANELCKAIDDNNELQPIHYRNVANEIVTVYVKPKINAELQKSIVDLNEIYEKSGQEIVNEIEIKRAKIRKEADVLRNNVDYLFKALDKKGLTPSQTTDSSASKYFTDMFGVMAVFSYEECFPPNKVVNQINNLVHLQKAQEAIENSSYCKQYNQAVHEYISQCTELIKLNDIVKSIDTEKTYKLNKQQLTTIFF